MISPDLPNRFLAPNGWQTKHFINDDTGHKIHYGFIMPDEKPPKAIIVCLGGLSEFSEKYFELAHDMLDRDYGFWFMDWAYQGRSSRLKDTPHRRHSDGFDSDISDLHKFITTCVMPFFDGPKIMMAHSMGAHIGLRFLLKYPEYFCAAAFSAPFFGIYNFNLGLKFISSLIRPLLPMLSKQYVFGGKDWRESSRKGDGTDIFSHDPMRDKIHNQWMIKNPELQIGSVTFGWVIHALNSCDYILNKAPLRDIKIPMMVALAGNDKIVDNLATKSVISQISSAKLVEIHDANHEILMEKDEYRNIFLNTFDKMVKENKIISKSNYNHKREEDMQGFTKNKDRLSDRVLYALELALQQQDLELSESLNSALELCMTRNSGGGEFVERRDYPKEIEDALSSLRQLKGKV